MFACVIMKKKKRKNLMFHHETKIPYIAIKMSKYNLISGSTYTIYIQKTTAKIITV